MPTATPKLPPKSITDRARPWISWASLFSSCSLRSRGARVQNIADELFGEKIDIIVWDEDPAVLISNVLRPAIVEGVYINEDEKSATAVVPEQQLSLAIGREGQNIRLAARVSGWKIDIKSNDQLKEMGFAFDEYEDSDVEEAGEVTEIEETQNN